MTNKSTIQFNKIETRSATENNLRKVVVKGYAMMPNLEHVYKHFKNSEGKIHSLRSLFTNKALDSMRKQLKHKRIFVDALHETAATMNGENILEELKGKDLGINKEIEALRSNLKLKELPMFKFNDFNVDDKGINVEVESNPYFAEIDDKHKKYYDAITSSIVEKYINGMSINFATKNVVHENGIDKIDDIDVFGISLVPDAALGEGSEITEVLMRSIVEVRSEEKKMSENVEEKQPEPVVQPTPVYQQKTVETKSTPKVDIDSIVRAKLDEALKQRDVEQQKEVQAKEYENMKKELEELKKQKEESKPTGGPKGTVKIEPEKLNDPNWFREKIANLSDDEIIQLQADFSGKIKPMIMEAKHKGQPGDPRVTHVWREPSNSMLEKYQQLKRSTGEDMNFSRK